MDHEKYVLERLNQLNDMCAQFTLVTMFFGQEKWNGPVRVNKSSEIESNDFFETNQYDWIALSWVNLVMHVYKHFKEEEGFPIDLPEICWEHRAWFDFEKEGYDEEFVEFYEAQVKAYTPVGSYKYYKKG